MNNLKPLVWNKNSKSWTAYGAGISYSVTEFDGVATVSWHNMVKSAKDLPFSSDKKALLSYSEALDFVEKEHYPHFMSEFVKPSSTWIDASERLPEEDGLYLTLRKGFTFEMGNESDLVPKVSGWNGGRGCFDDDHGNVLFTHWMPLPELPVSKESDCE